MFEYMGRYSEEIKWSIISKFVPIIVFVLFINQLIIWLIVPAL